MKNLFKSYPTQSHNIPSNPTIISLLLYIYNISSHVNIQSDKISLNQANLEQLQTLNGVGQKKAQAIIEYRQKKGGFKTIDELMNVKGIGPKLLEKNKAKLIL